ncbi:GIY-YIG nuclease family protein [Aggregatimonas sangjinii]|uniref:GIY-YIG nuclease family protein n=1 Tax=Aggregatimonas sangjinii TaxID=2583587 RepID=A0A5B7SQJ2_9FLAO|nr:GIY-YIG nuclease family protein [Aggregatimonas sangjinii]QCW99209.1 GIY-YIG nuclease family protein [Aggregatimonas sangjinii]
MHKYYVYILTNKNHTVLYAGMTNNLKSRIQQHKSKNNKSFTQKYSVHKLVYFEKTQYVNNAIKREKQLKHWRRQWKENLINDMNPDWNDLSWMLGD